MFCYDGHASPVTSLCYSPSGRYLVSCSDIGERAIRVWFAGMPLYDQEPVSLGLRLRWTRSGLIKRVRANTEPSAMEFFLSRQEDREIRESSDESEGEKVGFACFGDFRFCLFWLSIFVSPRTPKMSQVCACGTNQARCVCTGIKMFLAHPDGSELGKSSWYRDVVPNKKGIFVHLRCRLGRQVVLLLPA